MQGKWNRLSLRTLSSLCHHHNHFTLVMFAALIFIVVGSTARRCFQHRFSAIQKRNLHIDGKISTILHVFVFHSHLLLLQYHVRIFFFTRSGVIWWCYVLRFACASAFAYRSGLYDIHSINAFFFLYAIDLMSFLGMHSTLSTVIAHVSVCWTFH